MSDFLVKESEFSERPLIQLATRFAKSQCESRALGLLRISYKTEYLEYASNYFVPDDLRYKDFIFRQAANADEVLGRKPEQYPYAEVLCFQGKVTLSIRNGSVARRIPIQGGDAYQIVLPQASFRLIGFHAEDLHAYGPGIGSTKDLYFTFFIVGDHEQALQFALPFYESTSRELGIPMKFVFRPFPHFFDCGGPRTDFFSDSVPYLTYDQFLRIRNVVCSNYSGKPGCTDGGSYLPAIKVR
jgi:hypothetical protein